MTTLRLGETFYGEDLACIHADGFSALGEHAAGVVQEAFTGGVQGLRILDLGCGAGALAAPLCEAGAEVWGLDLSPDLLAIARRRAPRASLHPGSWLDADLPAAEVVCAIGEVLNYLADPGSGPDALEVFIRRAAQVLPSGGLLLFDAAAPGRGASRSFTEGEGWAVGSISEEADGVLTRLITTFRRRGEVWRRSEERHRLALYPVESVLGTLEQAGFKVEVLGGYGALTLPAGLPVYRARRN